jgi:hypothetical protein
MTGFKPIKVFGLVQTFNVRQSSLSVSWVCASASSKFLDAFESGRLPDTVCLWQGQSLRLLVAFTYTRLSYMGPIKNPKGEVTHGENAVAL